MENNYCLFCDKNNSEKHNILLENDFCYARLDNFPVNPGHIEIVPKPHIVSFFELNDEQLIKIYTLLKLVKDIVQKKYNPDGFNVGIN